MRDRRPVVVCDLSGVTEPDLALVDALARLRLTAHRLGYDLRVRGANARLRELLALTGLDEVIPLDGGSTPEPHRQSEQREQPLHVEEIRDRADPAG